MGDFFKPWRRKIGVLTLVIACVLAMRWAASYGHGEQFIFIISGFESKNGYVHLVRYDRTQSVQAGKSVYLDTGALNLPYLSIVIPLTLLSAYLLLSKPRGAMNQPTEKTLETL